MAVLLKSVLMSENVKPICLPTKNVAPMAGGVCLISGWGLNEHGRPADVLEYLHLTITEKQKCKQIMESVSDPPRIFDTDICAGSKGKDSCEGDSGGPLVCHVDGQLVLTGVISRGPGNCGNTPGIYTNVADYLDWINKKMIIYVFIQEYWSFCFEEIRSLQRLFCHF